MSPEDLVEVLAHVPPMTHPDLLEGHTRFSDAGVFRLRDDLAIVQTVDFFPPLVDQPRDYGRIAAANALSDVYAMGADPVTALNIVGFPSRRLTNQILAEIVAGGAEKVLEAGAVVVGGHSVVDQEIKYGLAVTGVAAPGALISNAGCRAGDILVLTKPIGTGSVATGIKRGRVSAEHARQAIEVMATLNRDASIAMKEAGAHGATDITGFGLLGHAREMAESSGVTLRLDPHKVPLLPGSLALAERGLTSGGARRNQDFLDSHVSRRADVSEALWQLLHDSETSGGLLISVAPEAAAPLVSRLRQQGHTFTATTGEVIDKQGSAIDVASCDV